MERLRISDNKRYFVTENGSPFIWLADTAWTMPQRMKWDDVDYFMKKRKSQGFTVLQMVALDPEQDTKMRNPVGEQALLQDDILAPNEKYFQYLDWIIEKAEEYGFYLLILPVWGQLVVGHNWMGEFSKKLLTEDNAYEYGKWIGNRYKQYNHIIWCLGGDRQPIHLGVDYRNVWRKLAEGLAKGVLDKDLQYHIPDEYWEKLLLTYHACHERETGECSTMSYWSEEEAWIRFIMLQSGHGIQVKNYELIRKEYDRTRTMPVWDGEPAYEMMPTSWPIIKDFHDEWIVRNRAYSGLFAGAFGHTYGHASVWCMISEKEKNKVSKYSWFEALEAPGAKQMKILRDFLESRDLSSCKPTNYMILSQKNSKEVEADNHIQACIQKDGKFACIYFHGPGIAEIEVTDLEGSSFHLWWFNPRDGKCYCKVNTSIDENTTIDNIIPTKEPILVHCKGSVLEVTTPSQGTKEDWVLVIEVVSKVYSVPGLSQCYEEQVEKEEMKKVFEW
jgi:hypothetical protein